MKSPQKTIQLHSTVILRYGNEERKYMIVRPEEVDVLADKISSESPLGRELLNKREEDVVEVEAPRGTISCQIVAVE